MKKRPAIFFDRDGTLIHEKGYLSDPKDIKLFSGASKVLMNLKEKGYWVFVITNQSGVARGYFKESDVKKANRRVAGLLKKEGARVDSFFYCPHHKNGTIARYTRSCDCRKPGIGMVRQAMKRFPIDIKNSWVIGDKRDDIRLSINAKMKGAVLVTTGHGKDEQKALKKEGMKVPIARSLRQAIGIIRRHC